MGIFAIGQNEMDGVGNLGCDTTADIPNLPVFAESNNLKPGTTCLCKQTSQVYMLGSNGYSDWDVL
jgi:hypothetical protein